MSLVLKHNSEVNIAKAALLTALARADLISLNYELDIYGKIADAAERQLSYEALRYAYELDLQGAMKGYENDLKSLKFQGWPFFGKST